MCMHAKDNEMRNYKYNCVLINQTNLIEEESIKTIYYQQVFEYFLDSLVILLALLVSAKRQGLLWWSIFFFIVFRKSFQKAF